MKKQSNLSRLMGYAGGHKILTYLSWVLSVMSALLALVPFWYIWCIIHDILEVSPDFSQAENVTGYGWSAVWNNIKMRLPICQMKPLNMCGAYP